MAIDVSLTFSLPSAGTYQLESPPDRHLVTFGAAGQTWRRHTVSSRYQNGDMLLSAVREAGALTGTVRFYGSTWKTQAEYFMSVLAQRSYTVTAVLDGKTFTYPGCQPGDLVLAGGLEKAQLHAEMQTFNFSIPYNPGGSL